MTDKRNAFSMVELIFVIVILGILAAVAIPKLSATRNDALIAKSIHFISSSINEMGAYAVSKGKVDANLSVMSKSVSDLVSADEASLDIGNMAVDFKMGGTADCIRVGISEANGDANLTIVENNSLDSLCKKLQTAFDPSVYNIKLTGANVVH